MAKKPLSTQAEEKILRAALSVFIKKGYKGATTRDIAAEAGITSPLLNYYFRSKENIFQIVYQRALDKLYYNIYPTISSDHTLMEKIPGMVDRLLGVLEENAEVPIFIFNEINQNPERLAEKLSQKLDMSIAYKKFAQQVDDEVTKGLIRPIHHITLLMNIQALCIYPLIAQVLICQITGTKTEEYTQLLCQRRDEIVNIILKDLCKKNRE